MTTRSLVMLALTAALLTGCTRRVSMTFINESTENVQVNVDGDHEGDERVGYIPPGDRRTWDLVVEADELPEDFTIEVSDEDGGDQRERPFTLTDKTPSRLWVVITESLNIAGPSSNRK
ncbi:MAG: hypothetical protein ACOCVI_01590 [Planctomycetota bacterium]